MSRFTFNGISSEDLGLIITQPIVRPSWSREVAELNAPGLVSRVMQRQSIYSNAELTVHTYLDEATPANVRSIYAALSGFGELILSTAPTEYLNVLVQPLVPEAVALAAAELPIGFTCRPFAHSVATTETAIGTDLTEVFNGGTVFAAPELHLTAAAGEAVVTVNGDEFRVDVPQSLSGKELIIDCELQVTYYTDGDSRVSVNQYTYGDYPLFPTGESYVRRSGTAQSASVIMRERWL